MEVPVRAGSPDRVKRGVAGRGRPGAPRPDRRRRRQARGVSHRDGGGGHRVGAAGRGRGDGGRVPGRPPRSAPGPQGPLLHAWCQDHRRVSHPGRVGPGRGRHGGVAARRRRRDPPRQAQHARVRLRTGRPEPPLRHAMEPMGCRCASRVRRLLLGLGRCRRRRPCRRRPRFGHRRLHPDPLVPVRADRPQADVRAGQPGRGAAAVVVARPRRAHVPVGPGLCAHARRHRRLRPPGHDGQRAARARLHGGPHRPGQGAPGRAAASLLPRVGGARGARVGRGRPRASSRAWGRW